MEWILVVAFCSGGAWNTCSGSWRSVERFPMQSEKTCMEHRAKFIAIKAASDGVESATCIAIQKLKEQP